jgi:tRNA (guanine37-N1)-methyltransferase
MSTFTKLFIPVDAVNMHFHVITLFPEVCRAYTGASILGRAQKEEKGKGAKVTGQQIAVSYYNPREYSEDKNKKVDERPYGGGPGMVMQALPVLKAAEAAIGDNDRRKTKVLIMSPRGTVLIRPMLKSLPRSTPMSF